MKESFRTLLKSRVVWSITAIVGALALVIPFTMHPPVAVEPTAQSQPKDPPEKPAVVVPAKPAPKPGPSASPPANPGPGSPAPRPGTPPATAPVVTPPATVPVGTAPVVAPPAVTPPVVTPSVTPPRRQTVVSLTFDDGNVDQLAAATAMNAYNIDGTFYVVSGYVGQSGFFTRADLSGLAAAGHEIGGHTVNHPDLAALPTEEVQRQVCTDRSTLLGWGFAVRSFAYPFASSTPENESAVAHCGYNSARMLGDIRSRFGCSDCDYAETLPPSDPYYTRALDQVDSTWTLTDLKNGVLNAERRGGWLQYTFHNICTTSCGELAVRQSVFTDFLAWLAPRAATMNTVTKTVGNAVGGAVKPAVAGPVVTPPTGGTSGVVNPGLEDVAGNGVPTCWFQAPYGDNVATFSLTTGRNGSSIANKISLSAYVSGDAKLLPSFDLGSCAPSVIEGHSYSLRSWYNSTTVTQFAVYLRTTSGAWQYWTSSPWFSPSTTWTEAEWTTPVIPAGYNGISFGLNIFANGVLITDDHSIYDAVGAPPADGTPPTSPAPPTPLVAPAPQEQQTTTADPPAEPVPAEPVATTPEQAPAPAESAPEETAPPAAEEPPVEPAAPADLVEGTAPQP